MRYSDFIVHFAVGSPMKISAMSWKAAMILAQAERIKAGQEYIVRKVDELEYRTGRIVRENKFGKYSV